MKLNKFLNQPYPILEESWKVIISISCFISLFLLIFQPFELSKVEGPYRYLIFIGYGGITFLALVFNMILLPSIFKDFFEEKSWTVKRQLLFFAWILFTIGIGNFIYTVLTTSNFNFDFNAFIIFQLYTFVIGIFPVTFLVIIQQNYLYRQHLQSASELNLIIPKIRPNGFKKNLIILPAENEKDNLALTVEQLFFIEAMGNYLKVFYRKNDKTHQEILRCSVKKAESAIEDFPEIIRCHRAYIVNLLKIEDAEGNSQGFRLKLNGLEHEIPVSRKYISEVKSHLEHLQVL